MFTHVAINVSNLDESIAFYSKLFDTKPNKVKANYARFMIEYPALHFTLNVQSEISGNQLSHFGFQVSSTEEVMTQMNRLEKIGLLTSKELNTTCCYAYQDKFWITDPDGNGWEYFYTKGDVHSIVDNQSTKACCS